METNLMESQTHFGIRLEGENEIEANLLSNTIRDVAELTKLAAKEENSEAYLKMNVTAFRNGSFQIDFSAVCQLTETIFTNSYTAGIFALTVVGTVKGFLEIKKLLKGEKPKNVTQTKDGKIEVENNTGQKITVNKSSGAIINNVQIDQLTVNISNYAQEHNPNGGFIFSTQDGDLLCSVDDVLSISKPIPIIEEAVCKRSRVEVDLPIKKPALLGHSSWEFKYEGHTITARIDDDDWIDEVNNGSVSVRAGDYIKATLEIYVELDALGIPIQDSEKYNILKVHGGIRHDLEQTTLWKRPPD